MLIDTHSHIYLKDFDSDREEMLKRSENDGVIKVLMPAIDNETHQTMLNCEARHPEKCISMMGLHPCSVKENFHQELEIITRYFEKRSFVAVGETGLDFYWDLSFTKEQYASFQFQIELAKQHKIPVVIHSRNSTDECIKTISENQKGDLKGVFHCFSGNTEQAKQVMDLGFYLGIGGVVTFKNSGLDKVISEIDLSKIILETDAPYLAPVPFRGKRNECCYLKYVVEKIADVKGISTTEVADITTKNAKELFSI
jgi:TatD DNase family protein